MKSVVITGATSMLGVALIRECIAQNVRVYALARSNSSKLTRIPQSPLVTIVECGLDRFIEADIEQQCDVFYHFAWEGTTGITRDDPFVHYKNIGYSLAAIELAKRCGCKKFIGAGSQAEYGIYAGKLYPSTRVDPVSSYGVAKYAAGKLCAKICEGYGMTCIWPRIFSVYGENDRENALIKYAIRQFMTGNEAQFSSATQKWNYLCERDAGRIFYLLGQENVKGGVYNVASADTRPLKEFISDIWEVCGCRGACIFASPSDAPVVSLDPDITSLVDAIGWMPNTIFKDEICNMINKTRGGIK